MLPADAALVAQLEAELQLAQPVARVVASRFPSVEDARRHLEPKLARLSPPRGMAGLVLAVDRIAILEARYRYPIIIDRGFTSILWVLPGWLARQIDIELFATVASEGVKRFSDRAHAAVGGSLNLSTVWWWTYFDLRYEVARRLTDDEALTHTLGFTVGL